MMLVKTRHISVENVDGVRAYPLARYGYFCCLRRALIRPPCWAWTGPGAFCQEGEPVHCAVDIGVDNFVDNMLRRPRLRVLGHCLGPPLWRLKRNYPLWAVAVFHVKPLSWSSTGSENVAMPRFRLFFDAFVGSGHPVFGLRRTSDAVDARLRKSLSRESHCTTVLCD